MIDEAQVKLLIESVHKLQDALHHQQAKLDQLEQENQQLKTDTAKNWAAKDEGLQSFQTRLAGRDAFRAAESDGGLLG